MALVWFSRRAPNVARPIGQGIFDALSASRSALLLQSFFNPFMDAFLLLPHRSQCQRVLSESKVNVHHFRKAQPFVHEQLDHNASIKFLRQYSTLRFWVPHFGMNYRNSDAYGGALVKYFRVGLRRCRRSLNTNSSARDLEKGIEPGPPREAYNKGRKQPFNRTCRPGSSIKQLKIRCFDDIIEREKLLKIVLLIRDLLGAEPSRSMTILDLGKNKEKIGFKGSGRLIAFLKRYPGIFIVHETRGLGKLPWFQFTPEAESVFEEELEIRNSMNSEVVIKLQKLLMMSSDRTLSLSKIAHLGRDLGLPVDFRKSLVNEYPKHFRVVGSKCNLDAEGPKLELVCAHLAFTDVESKANELGRDYVQISESSRSERSRLIKFDEVDCPLLHQDANHLRSRSFLFEKRAVLLVQELLSLTLEKRLLVDHLTHFRNEFKFSKKLHGMLIRHPEHFYVSRKGPRDTVFLRKAFQEIHMPGQRKECCLIDKHPLVLVKEKFAALMRVDCAASSAREGSGSFQGKDTPAQTRSIPAESIATIKDPW